MTIYIGLLYMYVCIYIHIYATALNIQFRRLIKYWGGTAGHVIAMSYTVLWHHLVAYIIIKHMRPVQGLVYNMEKTN